MKSNYIACGTALIASFGMAMVPAAAQDAAHKSPAVSSFTRLVTTGKSIEVLETRAVKLVPSNGQGPIIWLVGAAHIGQASYYKTLQKLLDEQSLVLFEGVKKDDSGLSKPASAPAAMPKEPFPSKGKSTYLLFANAVGLDFQLDDIDYTRKTFKNCDLTWAQVTDLSAKQGQSTKGTVSSIGKLLDADSPEGHMFGAFLEGIKSDPGSQEAMRIVLAEALSKPGLLEGFLGEGTSDVLIKSRNQKVLSDLDSESASPSIAIFFGAAHMPDMEHRLVAEKHYRETEERWIPAISGDKDKVTGTGVAILSTFRTLLTSKKA